MWELYTDGACQPNPGFGGWCFILKNDNKKITQYGWQHNTTNNRMELSAFIFGLRYFIENIKESAITLCSDSIYVINGANLWIEKWKQNDWKKQNGDEILNNDLWKEIDCLVSVVNISYVKIKGHSGNLINDEADFLANTAIIRSEKMNEESGFFPLISK